MSIRIIVADDHGIMRQGLCSLLEEHPDMEVVAEAENGQVAVQLARELAPDVVVMDIAMPGLNGIVAARQILAEDTNVKVIALTMHSDRQFVMEMLDTGVAGYLLKDCAFEELARAIKAVLTGGKYLSPEIARIVIDNNLAKKKVIESSALAALTPRERDVIKVITDGKNTKQAAAALQLSTKTVESHRRRILKKLGVTGIAELTIWAIREGLISISPHAPK